MAVRPGTFILTEAMQMLPLVRSILRDVREARSRLCRLARRSSASSDRAHWQQRLADALREAAGLGIEISNGVRCEALFPFDHQWVGPQGDNKIRPAYFVFDDASATIDQWFFSGWPNDRRKVNPKWRLQYRPTPATRMKVRTQEAV